MSLTFLLTDIEGSTERWERDPGAMRDALARHDELIRAAVEDRGGRVFKSAGDGLWAVFDEVTGAVVAAVDAVASVEQRDWGPIGPLRIRVGLHGADAAEVEERDGDFFGTPLNRCARIVEAAHGGQILVSDAVRRAVDGGSDAAGWSLRDLGEHRLRDLRRAERLHQIVHPALRVDFPPIASLGRFPNNLPEQRTSFVGREAELAELAPLVGAERLVTLTGPAGVGKTRLAIALAAELLEGHPDGAWLVELAALRDPSLLVQAVATSLGLREQRGRELIDLLTDHIRDRRALLVLDNCEHLLDSCAQLADHLLAAAPELHVIATSREPLGVSGEHVREVPTLDTDPAPDDDAGSADAVELFLDRAGAVAPDVVISGEARRTVARICRRLDGIPLAIELAAARLPVLSPAEIDERLDDRFRLLARSGRTTTPQHRTLRAAIDWSHDLLDDTERVLFRRFAVFAGSVDLDAVETVVVDERLPQEEVLDTLARLVQKSLVLVTRTAGRTTYGMLETVRVYAREKLIAAGESAQLRDEHADWVLRHGDDIRRRLRESNFVSTELSDHDLRAALDRLEDTDPSAALRLATAVAGVWWAQGRLAEARRRVERALERAGSELTTGTSAGARTSLASLATSQGDFAAAEAHAREVVDGGGAYPTVVLCWWVLGVVAWARGDLDVATAHHETGLQLAREIGHRNGEALHLNSLARVQRTSGDLDRAETLHLRALESYRRDGDTTGAAEGLDGLARVAYLRGDLERARELADEGGRLYETGGYVEGIASTLTVGAAVALASGEQDDARDRLERALGLYQRMGHRGGLANAVEVLAAWVAAADRPRVAASLLGTVEAIRAELGEPSGGDDPLVGPRLRRDLRRALGDDFEAAVADGAEFDVAAAIEVALTATREPV